MPNSKPFYTAADTEHLNHQHSDPGQAPYTRGPYAQMYRKKPWTIRQYTGFASSTETNIAFKKTLAEGGQGLSVAFDLPTHLGFDSDHPAAQADVGRTGVAIDSVEDMKQLFSGIDLSTVSVSMTMNGAVLPVLAAFIVAAEESGADPARLRGTIQNDILKEFMVRNTYIFEPQESMRICTDVVEYLNRELPHFNSMSISGYHFQEAGAEPALELALTLANAFAYLDEITQRGLSLDHFCPRLSFFFGVGMNFFDEIAKLRAARMLWSQAVERRGVTSDKAKRMKMHCQTSGWSLTAQEPLNNVMRTTIEAMAAVFGGTQSLHTNGFDEALNLPSAEAARLARNTQLIMQEEAGLCDVADPWGGSYMMESLTDQIASRTTDYLNQIERQGGILAVLKSGWIAQQIQQNALRIQNHIDSGEKTIIGVNHFVGKETKLPEVTDSITNTAIDTATGNVLRTQKVRLRQLKQKRNARRVQVSLERLSQAAANQTDNLLEFTIAAIRNRATVGECTQALLKHFRRHLMHTNFIKSNEMSAHNTTLDWQKAQSIIRQFQHTHLRRPSILLSKLGLDGHDRGIKVIASGLERAGFNVDIAPLFSTPEQVSLMYQAKHYDAVGISLLSGAHLPLLEKLVHAFERSVPDHQPTIFLGGIIPDQDTGQLSALGVNQIFRPATRIDTMVLSITESLKANRSIKQASRQQQG